MKQADFIETIYQIAKKCGCTVNINFETHIINFDGPDEAKEKLVEELNKILE